jgi:hypothetical protein
LQLLKLSEELNQTYKQIIFLQFMNISTLLCVLGFQVVIVDSVTGRIVPAIFGLTMLIQLLVYAFGGQLVLDKSKTVAENLYKIDRDMILMIARPLKPVVMKSGFFKADLPTFVSIINAAGSLITMLKSFFK